MKWRTGILAGLLCGLLTVQAAAYSDVENHWALGSIERWSANGIVTGYTDGSFRPDQTITRGELAALLARVFAWTDQAENTFTDLPEDSWCTDYVLCAAEAGVLQGSGGLVRPEAAVTRQEAAVMYCRAFDLEPAESEQSFPDEAQIADWAKSQVDTLLANGWIQGTDTGEFAPQALFTRSQAVTMLDNMVADYIAKAGAVQQDVEGTVLVASAGATLQKMTVDGDVIITGSATGSEVVLHNVEVTGRLLVLAGDGSEIRISGTTSAPLLEVRGTGSWVTLAGTPMLERILVSGSQVAIDGLETGTEVEIDPQAEKVQVNGHVCEPGTVVQAQPGSSLGNVDVDISIGGGGGGSNRLDPPAIQSKGSDSITIQTKQGVTYLLRDELGETTASYTAQSDGTHTFTGLVRGAYTLTAERDGYEASEPVSVYVSNGMIVIDWGEQEG